MKIQLRGHSQRVERVSRETIDGWERDASYETGYVRHFYPSEYWCPVVEERWEPVGVEISNYGTTIRLGGGLLPTITLPPLFRAHLNMDGTLRFERKVS
jgi:hypothetical protein